mgnify:CR=1 FL=1
MRLLISALMLFALHTVAASTPALSVDHGQVRQPMPGRTVTAGYFSLHNGTAEAVQLVGASSPLFARVELHQHSHKDGMMRMEQIEHIVIPAGESVELAPGGLHLMLFEAPGTLQVGQSIELILHFADGQQLPASLPVVAMPQR